MPSYISIQNKKGETSLSPLVKYFSDHSKAVLLLWIIFVIFVLFLLCFCAGLFNDALWSPAGKGLTEWLSFVKSNCEVVTFPLVSCTTTKRSDAQPLVEREKLFEYRRVEISRS